MTELNKRLQLKRDVSTENSLKKFLILMKYMEELLHQFHVQ